MRNNALAELFPRASMAGTVLENWSRGRFLLEHGAPKELEERIAERFSTPEALAEFAPGMPVSVYGFRGQDKDVKDLHTFPATTISEAVPLYHAGHTVICWRLLDHLPEALRRGSDFLEALGMPNRAVAARGLREPWNNSRLFVVSLVYSRADTGSGLGLHFDRFDSVVVQLRGSKRWRVGRHPYLENPTYNEEAAEKLGFPPALPRLATRSEHVTDLTDIELRRGSVLLLPRGTYHTTLADGAASLSIGYHFALPTWSDVILAGLERRLTRDPFLRSTPFGAFSTAGPSEQSLSLMAEAAERTRAALDDPRRLLCDDLLGELAGPHQAAFRLAPATSAKVIPGDPPVIAGYGGHGIEVELAAETAPLCRWLAGGDSRWFAFSDALAAVAGEMSELAVWNLLQEGVEAGLLERRWGAGTTLH